MHSSLPNKKGSLIGSFLFSLVFLKIVSADLVDLKRELADCKTTNVILILAVIFLISFFRLYCHYIGDQVCI